MITRSVYVAKGKVVEIWIENGDIKDKVVSDLFKISTTPIDIETERLNLTKLNPGKILVITEYSCTKEIRGITLEDFYLNSKVVERPQSQLKKENE